jgi:hypothetical protein
MSTYDEDRLVYNAHYEVEVLIDQPVNKVWRQFVDVVSWVVTHDIEEVAGTRGTVGAITRVSFKKAGEMGMPLPHHHYCKIVKLIPERQYVLKTYSEKGGSYGNQMRCFDDTRFVPVNRSTKIIFNFYVELTGEAMAQDRDSIDLAMETSREGMLRNLNNLKNIVEGH